MGALVSTSLLLALPAQGARHKVGDRFCATHGALSAAALPARVSADRCDLIGRRVTHGSLSLRVPPPGLGVAAAAIGPGGESELAVTTLSDGTVRIDRSGSSEAVTVFGTGEPEPCDSPSADGCLDPCTDTNHHVSLPKRKVREKQPWYFKQTTTPASLTQQDALAQIKLGTQNIVKVNNDCARSDFISRTAAYKGTTTTGTGITIKHPSSGPRNSCSQDGKNVVDFGKLVPLSPGADPPAGLACTSYTSTPPRFIVEADIRLNKDTAWTITPDDPECFNLINLQGVVTHERGHAFGLSHTDVDSTTPYSHLPQTMFPASYPCSSYNNTLGLGDIQALNELY